MKIYQVIKTSVSDCSRPSVEVSNFTDITEAKAKFDELVNDFEPIPHSWQYDENDYEVSESDDDFECYLVDDALMDYGRVQLVESEVK